MYRLPLFKSQFELNFLKTTATIKFQLITVTNCLQTHGLFEVIVLLAFFEAFHTVDSVGF